MKVVEDGSLVGRTVGCESCGSQFRIESEDSPEYALEDMSGTVLQAMYQCPQCLHLVTVQMTTEEHA